MLRHNRKSVTTGPQHPDSGPFATCPIHRPSSNVSHSNMTARSTLLLVAALAAALPAAAGPKPLTTDGKVAGISAKFRATLAAQKLRIVVPTWLPKGFKLIEAHLEPNPKPELRDVWLTYRRPGGAEITIQFASDGIGDPFFDLPDGDTLEATGSVKGKSPIFGPFELNYVSKGQISMWHTTWYELKQKGYPTFVMAMGDHLSTPDAKRLVESLRWLK